MKPRSSFESVAEKMLFTTPWPLWHKPQVGESSETTRTESVAPLNQSFIACSSTGAIPLLPLASDAFVPPFTDGAQPPHVTPVIVSVVLAPSPAEAMVETTPTETRKERNAPRRNLATV